MTRRQGRHGKNFNRATVTMKPGSAVGPRGAAGRRPGGDPLPPKGVAAGPEPTVTGVVAQGDRTVIVSGRNLTGVHFYVQGAAIGPDAHLLSGKKGERYMYVEHGDLHWDGKNISIPKGSYNLWKVLSRNDSKIVLGTGAVTVGKVTIYGFAQDKAPGKSKNPEYDVHFGSGSQGKPITTTGFPKTIQFGGIKSAAGD